MSRRFVLPLVLLLAVLASLPASAQEPSELRLALREAEEPLRARDWPAAAERLRLFRQKHAGTKEAIEAWVLETRALLLAGAAREALDLSSRFLEEHGESAWAGQMKGTAAGAYAALSEPKEAADVLRERVNAATAPQARAAMAALHLELADADFVGVETTDDLGRKTKKRDVPRALASYRHALAMGVAPSEEIRVREHIALCLEETAKAKAAADVWNALLQEVERGTLEATDVQKERMLVGRGRARLGAGLGDEARKDLRDALARYPGGKLQMETLLLLGEERLKAAAKNHSEIAFEEGVTWLRRAILEHRDDERAADAQKRLAEAYGAQGQSEKAAAEWGAFVERFPDNAFAPKARDRQARALEQAGHFDEAIAAWESFLAAWPNDVLWQQVRERITAAAFAKGEALRQAKDTEGAVAAWRAFARRYPADARAPEALLRAGRLLREEKAPDAAILLFRQVAGRYAKTPQAPAALLLVATTLEVDLGRLEDAVGAYEEVVEKYPRSKEAQDAKARLERLKAHHLELRLERVVGTSEPPVIRVTTRNVKALDVRVYRLEMEEYFRRKGTVLGVENLQLEVVKPDETACWTLDDYQPFALIEADREVPVKGPGAYVVVAGDEHLTATALFLVSDVEIVVKKAQGDHLFVWAFDRNGQKPVPGAKVLAASNGKVREVGLTGEDGVWQGRSDGNAAHVLVITSKGCAATELGSGPDVVSGFSSKAYVTTDRPVYRPGQEVNWRAIFLQASGGGYLPPTAREGTVCVHDARGQTLFEKAVTSSSFGTFAGSFPLDALAPLGVWKIQIAVKHQGSWTGEFEVQEFKKPEFTLDLVPLRPIYLTGETVEAIAKVAYAFGGPVTDAPVAYEVFRVPHVFAPKMAEDYTWYFRDDRRPEQGAARPRGTLVKRGETRTNDAGEATISFVTADLDEDAEYVVRIAVEDITRRWIVDEGQIPVTRCDYMAVVKTDRKVYRPRQEMNIEIRTVDALERAVSRSGTLRLLELRQHVVPNPEPLRRGGRPVVVREEEVERAAYPVTTGAGGSADVRVAVPGPGRWRLRWRGLDGRGALVTAFADIEASGEAEDPSRDARLIAAKPVWTEGDEAEVLLRSPVTGVTALLTYEGERVLGYGFVEVKGASTLLSLPVGGEYAPNVFFKIAIPGKGRLLEAETEVVVLRYLDVEVRMPATAGPGQEVEVQVRTRDARGKPTAAEVGLALVDETLYAIARDRTPAIRPYFYDRRRENAVLTVSSLGFHAFGTTRETNQDLLADEAARHGNLERAMAESALRNAEEALNRGDVRTAAILALRAAEAAPDLYEARAFLARLRESHAARKALSRVDRGLLDELKRTAPMEPSASPMPSSGRAKDGKWEEEMEDEDALADATFTAPANNGLVGLGGGAGGVFGGRAGKRSLKSKGGGGRMHRERRAVPQARLGALEGRIQADKATRDLHDAQFGFDAGFLLDVRKRFADVASWQPHLVTGEDGRATVTVELPDNLTTWRAVVRGVSSTALVGAGRARLVSRRDLIVRVDTPRFLVQGDSVTVPIAVHNETASAQDVRVLVTSEGVDLKGGDETLELGAGARGVLNRDASAPSPGRVRIEASAVADGAADRTEVIFGTLPRGIKVVEGRSGVVDTARGALQETFLDVPEGAVAGATRLAVVLYPGIDAALLDALLYLDLYPYGCIEQTVHRFLPALDARAALLAAGSPAAARLDRLDEAVKSAAVRLRNLQNDDGSFGWFRSGKGDLAMTAYALLGLAGARGAGVDGLDQAIVRATASLMKLVQSGDEDARSLGHFALSSVGAIQKDAYGTTFRRRRDDLSVDGLAWMAMAAKGLGRSYDADELIGLLLERRVEEKGTTHWKGKADNCFTGSDREATGLAVRALLIAGRDVPHAERGIQWLLTHRVDGGFGSTKDTAAFVGAASAWVTRHGAQGYGGTIEVLLDGTSIRTIEVGPAGIAIADRRFLVPEASDLSPERHRLAFRLTGQGKLRWALRLECVVASDELPEASHGLSILRRYLRPTEAPVEGQPPPVKPGYEVLRPAARPRIEARELQVVNAGDCVLVRLEVNAPRDLEYVLAEDPLPAGFEVLGDTAQGPFDWQERRDDRQVFFCSKLAKGTTVFQYVIQATHWGRFTALGTTAYAMYLPEVHGRAKGYLLTVAREKTPEISAEHPPTPDELYERAVRLFEKGHLAEAASIFQALVAEQPLRDGVVENIEVYLLKAAIEADQPKQIVRAREALVRRNPGRIPNDWHSQRVIAFAYHTLDEYEMASSLYRDLVARGFGLHVDWMQTLIDRGRAVEGLDSLGAALARFPISNATADAAFRQSQRYRELPRPEGRDGKTGRPMDRETLDALWSFTAHYAETPLADPANFALIGALRRAGDAMGAATVAEAFLGHFPGSRFEDDARYFLAASRFRTFERDPSEEGATLVREAAKPLVERKFPGPDGRPAWSEYRARAWFLLARLEHVLGNLDQAIKDYHHARAIEDARETYAFLTEERLDLDETLVVPLEGGVELPIRYRNVGKVVFKAYPVDLQVLFAVRKSLEGLHDVDLSGIVPAHEWVAEFPDAKDHMGHEGRVDLPVEPDKPGAWLVVAKAGDHEAKTLVVKTDLTVVLQRIGEKVCVYVTDGEGRNVRDAYVTVADGARIRARGLTDGRGIFEAPGVGAQAAVVVSKGDRYAVAR